MEDIARGGSVISVPLPARNMNGDDRRLIALLAKLGDIQWDMVTQHSEFQISMANVLTSHDNQLAVQVATHQSTVNQMGDFQ